MTLFNLNDQINLQILSHLGLGLKSRNLEGDTIQQLHSSHRIFYFTSCKAVPGSGGNSIIGRYY